MELEASTYFWRAQALAVRSSSFLEDLALSRALFLRAWLCFFWRSCLPVGISLPSAAGVGGASWNAVGAWGGSWAAMAGEGDKDGGREDRGELPADDWSIVGRFASRDRRSMSATMCLFYGSMKSA